VNEIPTKKCTGCGEVLEASEDNFFKSNHGKYGFEAKCKTCRGAQIKAWQKANEDTERIRSKKWRREHPEYVQEYDRFWAESGGRKRAWKKRQSDPEKHSRDVESHRRWVKANPEKNKQSMAAYKANNIEKRAETYKKQDLKKKYGITLEQYSTACANQNNCCFLCKKPVPTLNVDHCHKTTFVRGLLCPNCNHMLGHAKDNPEVLRRGIAYLMNPPGLLAEPRSEYFENSVESGSNPVIQSEAREETCEPAPKIFS
jgi:hypothetical protein